MPRATLKQEIESLKARVNPVPSLASLPVAAEIPDPFDDFDLTVHPDFPAAHHAAREWTYAAARGEPAGLVLWSEATTGAHGQRLGYGCGKTRLARAAHAYLRQCSTESAYGHRIAVRVSFQNSTSFYAAFRDLYALNRPEYPLLDEWASGPFILDDLGKEYIKTESLPWAREKFYRLIDRLCERHALLITSNLSPEAIEAFVGGAAWSRLLGMCGPRGFVNLSAIPDHRLKKAGFMSTEIPEAQP